MKRCLLFLVVVCILFISLFPFLSASSIDSEIQKITYYAEEYETGNINYVQLLVYTSSARQNMNLLLGATEKEAGGILKQEQIQAVLGEPSEKTKWVWVEGLNYETKLDSVVPFWRKIIFDGNKIQIRLSAYPSIFYRQGFNTEGEKESEKQINLQFSEEDVIYRLNIETRFKQPKDQLNIFGKIDEIKLLAQNFNSNPTDENAEELAKTSVDAEKLFWNYFEQFSGKCEDLMISIFGSENKREDQKLIVQEIIFYEGENFEVILRLEMCDECQWNWIGLDMRIESRGKFKVPEGGYSEPYSKERYASMSNSEFESQIAQLLDEIKSSLDEKDYAGALSSMNKLKALNNAWNEKANDVWKQIDEIYRQEEQSMTDEQRRALGENYGWIKRDQERRQKEIELRKQNYDIRKQFYLNLLSPYEKSEFYYSQIQFEKRLVEEFVEFGEEICDNNQDDNNDGNVDCADSQCSGKICGKQSGENGTIDLYCIANTCQAKEVIVETSVAVCGNHLCEQNETKENCAEDCSLCEQYPALECAGKIIFKGQNEKGCPLEPICVKEDLNCTTTAECTQPLCGSAECIEGFCKLTGLNECKEAECVDGDKKIQKCENGEEIVVGICTEGLWLETGVECEAVISPTTCEQYCASQPHILCEGYPDISGTYPSCNCRWICKTEEPVAEDECSVKEDCGNPNDVCSNGDCVTIPEVIRPIEPSEPTEEKTGGETEAPESPEAPEESSEPSATAEVILNFFKNSFAKIILTITGRQIEGEEGDSLQNGIEGGVEGGDEGSPPSDNYVDNQQNNYQDDKEAEEDRRRHEERERREDECERQCDEMCFNMKITPCVDKCIREVCGDMLDCNIDEKTPECEQTCKEENNLEECTDDCFSACLKGEENWWEQFKPEETHPQMEKGVFNSGGGCRTSQARTETFIWFNGWGEPFERIEPLKQKYYTGGQTEWCKYDLENLEKQREEFEKGFNQEFVTWFFEDYLANSADEWEQHVSGIFELYWKNVDNLREMAMRMNCLELTEFPTQNLISVEYESEYGKIEYWEEMKTVRMPELNNQEVTIISPYMRFWIFPPKEFIEYEMKKAMASGEFPGSPEDKMNRKNNEGPTEEEKAMIRENQRFMDKITAVSEKYGGSLDLVVQFKDFETNEIVFNVYVQINENDIIKMKPMPPEQIPAEDVRVEIDFQEIYDLVYSMQKEMQGEQTESPPWDKGAQKGGIKEMTNGIKMSFKVNKLFNSAQVYPEEARGDFKYLAKTFFGMMKGGGGPGGKAEQGEEGEGGEDLWASLEDNSGE